MASKTCFRILFSYTYEIDIDKFPKEVRKYPQLMVEQEAQFAREILKDALEKSKDGMKITMDVIEYREY